MKPEEAIPLLQRGLVGEIYDAKGFLTALGYEALDAIDSSNCKTLVQKQHGEWIEGVIGYHYCSKCHNYALADDDLADDDGKEVLSNFCPNCGSDNRPREGDLDDGETSENSK